MTFSRLKDSITPERLMTFRLAVSIVENRPPHSGHCRRRRMLRPSSLVRESITRESAWRQNGQCIAETAYAGIPVSVLEAGRDGLAVCGERLGLGEGHDRVVDCGESTAVVLDDLLR